MLADGCFSLAFPSQQQLGVNPPGLSMAMIEQLVDVGVQIKEQLALPNG